MPRDVLHSYLCERRQQHAGLPACKSEHIVSHLTPRIHMVSKHRKQMSQSEIQYAEMLIHSIDNWKFDNPHLYERMMQKGISKKDAVLALKFGAVIRVQNDGRVLMRLMQGERSGVCVVASLKDRTLVTVWYNSPTDNHATLNLNEYTWKANTTDFLRSIQ